MRLLPICVAIVAWGRGARAPNFEAQVAARLAQVPGASVGVYLKDLATDSTWMINADSSFHAMIQDIARLAWLRVRRPRLTPPLFLTTPS